MAQRLLEGEADVMGAGREACSEGMQTVAVDSVEVRRPRSVGVASEDRIQWLREEGYRYLVASRQGPRQFDPALAVETASKATVEIHKEVSEDGKEVRLYCCSQKRAEKEKGIVERFQPAFRAGAHPTLRGVEPAADSQGHREGPGIGSGG